MSKLKQDDRKIAQNFYDAGTIAFCYTVLNYLYSGWLNLYIFMLETDYFPNQILRNRSVCKCVAHTYYSMHFEASLEIFTHCTCYAQSTQSELNFYAACHTFISAHYFITLFEPQFVKVQPFGNFQKIVENYASFLT